MAGCASDCVRMLMLDPLDHGADSHRGPSDRALGASVMARACVRAKTGMTTPIDRRPPLCTWLLRAFDRLRCRPGGS